MKVTVTQKIKNQKLDYKSFIKYQIISYCHFKNIRMSSLTDSVLDLLSLLVEMKSVELKTFCELVTKIKSDKVVMLSGKIQEANFIFKTSQVARNVISKFIEYGVICKDNKSIHINPEIDLVLSKNALLTLQILTIDTDKD